jgi:threonine-phosphate decarboxylase
MMTHGGRVIEWQRKSGRTYLDFSANLNPWGPPREVKERWGELFYYATVYPPLDCSFYREELAKIYNLSSSFILPTNGATTGIYLLARQLPGETVLILEPCFSEYARSFSRAGKKIERVFFPVPSNSLPPADIVVWGNPTNPWGVSPPSFLLDYLWEMSLKKGTILVVDEAFQEFIEEKTSWVSRLGENPRLYIIRSLTKYFTLPGLRGGFIAAHPSSCSFLEEYLEPWSINSLLARVLEIIAQGDLASFRATTQENLRREKRFIEENLKGEIGELFPSEVNFYTIRLRQGKELFSSFLEERGILVRSLSDFFGLDDSYFRIAVRTREENQQLIEAVRDYARELG